jgi:hypothetical protein
LYLTCGLKGFLYRTIFKAVYGPYFFISQFSGLWSKIICFLCGRFCVYFVTFYFYLWNIIEHVFFHGKMITVLCFLFVLIFNVFCSKPHSKLINLNIFNVSFQTDATFDLWLKFAWQAVVKFSCCDVARFNEKINLFLIIH